MQQRIEEFIRALEQDNPGVEAVMLYQNGQMVCNRRFVPPGERLIYSHTKSFVSTAAGIAIDQGKLYLHDRLTDLLPQYAGVVTDPGVHEITLRDLLTMSSGFGGSFLMHDGRRNGEGFPDYCAYMLSKPLAYKPGERFVYSNADTHLAGCMVAQAVGEGLMSFLYCNLFEKLGMGYPAWEADPQGRAFGGSGLYLSIEQMIKLGILYLEDGVYNGQRLLSHQWVTEAGKPHIATGSDHPWNSGYGYQFWTIGQQLGAFRADGAYGQYSMILPQDNAVIAIQSCEQNDTGKLSQLILSHIVEKINAD